MTISDHYFELVKQSFDSQDELMTEIINLGAISHLPKGTEFFLSDIHGEAAGLRHLLNTASGILSEKLKDCFQNRMSSKNINQLSKLISYPAEYLTHENKKKESLSLEWQTEKTKELFTFMSYCASKYSRSKVRKRFPKKYAYIFDELLSCVPFTDNKLAYFQSIVADIVGLEIFRDFIMAICQTIHFLLVDHLHIVGDIFDRGENSFEVMEILMHYPSIDFQWGNHDVLWLGAFCGSHACLVTLLRIGVKYGYLNTIERDYQINLRKLYEYATTHFDSNPSFSPDVSKQNDPHLSQIHQALLCLQLKLEQQIILRNSDFSMSHRLIKTASSTISCTPEGMSFLADFTWKLSREEEDLLQEMVTQFQNSSSLKRHLDFLVEKGSMYLIYNNVLLFHGCIPLDENGKFCAFLNYSGKKLLDFFDNIIRTTYQNYQNTTLRSQDLIWYCWCGPKSPLYGRQAMKTFESYFAKNKEDAKEISNAYFQLRDTQALCLAILEDFGLSENGTIVNGHTPIRVKDGESPIKAQGMLFVIDGGLSKHYQKRTGIAGYTLINNSYGFQLVSHESFMNLDYFLQDATDGTYVTKVIDQHLPRRQIANTNIGSNLANQRALLCHLLHDN